MKKVGILIGAIVLLAAGYLAGSLSGRGAAGAPGASASPAPEKKAERKIAFYRSPMDPNVHSDQPTQDWMGMDFIPVYEDEVEAPQSNVPGRAAITIPADRRQLLGVRSEELKRGPLARSIRTVGRVTPDERLLHHIHTKYDGFIEHVYVDFIGKYVKRGEPLLSIYSPDLFATQQEYLLARRGVTELAKTGGDTQSRSTALVDAVRQRLLLWDIRPEEIEKLEKEGIPRRTVDLYADLSGFVLAKTALHGMRVTPVDSLFDIADLSRVWILADVYEADLPSIRLGMSAEIELSALPGRKLRGPVTFISPTVEPSTRTTKVRIEVANTGGLLKPDMFADVSLQVDLGSVVVAPEGAIIDAGDRKLAFVDIGEGRYEPREVTLGAKTESGYVVLKGLVAGEKVVVAANFLIDSESSLRAAVEAMRAPSGTPKQ